MAFFYTARFLRTFSKLDPNIQEDVESAIGDFKKGSRGAQLKLHKLHGRMKQYHAFSANYSIRIVIKIEKGVTYFMDVGDHNVYM